LRDWYRHGEGPPRLRLLPPARLVRIRELYTDDELKTSPARNEGLRLLGGQDGFRAAPPPLAAGRLRVVTAPDRGPRGLTGRPLPA